jgi:transcriptional regulator with XRE-family HTH domain
MNAQLVLQKTLADAYGKVRDRNPSYSQRAFARKAGLSSSAVSEILNGKRRISPRLAERVLTRLELAPDVIQGVVRALGAGGAPGGHATDETPKARRERVLDMDAYHLVADWYHFAILSLAETRGFKSSPAWIARRLGLRPAVAQAAIDRLVRLGMLKRSPRGVLSVTGEQYATSDGVVNASLRRSNAEDLELARRSLEEDPYEDRDFATMTMAIDPAKLPEARRLLREFRDRLCVYLEADRKTEVYKFCAQLIPLSKKEKTP